MTKRVKFLSLIMALAMLVASFGAPASTYAASASPKTVYSAVKKAYGKKFPMASGSKSISSSELGVSKKWFKTAYGRQKGTKTRYIVYIAKAGSTSKAKKIQSALNKYIKNERQSMGMYLSSKGKKLYANAKVGKKGKYVYLVMVDTNSNTKAISAIKKALS